MVRRYAPAGHRQITTLLAGLASDGIIAPFVVDEPMDRGSSPNMSASVSCPNYSRAMS